MSSLKDKGKDWELVSKKVVFPDKVKEGMLKISQGNLLSPNQELEKEAPILELENGITYPALINAHDHLIGTYSPPVTNQAPYLNWLSWDNQLKSSLVFSERQMLDPLDLYLLGAYKNIFGGTTTVVDHIPHFLGKAYRAQVPIRVLENYTLSHSVGSYSLGWGEGAGIEYQEAATRKIPYITHIGEGLDEDSLNSLKLLDKLNALGEYSVLVHGIPFGPREVLMIKNSKASMVWCPTSNSNLYRAQPPVDLFLEAGIPVSLGTDLALAGTSNILQELKNARKFFYDKYKKELPWEVLYSMVTTNPAKSFRIQNIVGSLEPGKKADLLVLKENFDNPFQNLVESTWEDIILLTKEGIPILADERLEPFLHDLGLRMEKIRGGKGTTKLLVPGLRELLHRIYSILGYKKDLAFFPRFEFIESEENT